jgi:chemotaxis methyl-accepting protein methylase
MNPGGYLFLGGSETLFSLSDRFISHTFDKTIVYEKA